MVALIQRSASVNLPAQEETVRAAGFQKELVSATESCNNKGYSQAQKAELSCGKFLTRG